MDAESRARIEGSIRRAWQSQDPDARVEARDREDGKLDLMVVSRRFEGLDSAQREALFWPACRSLPASDLVRMTYGLLLTPGEAARYFGAGDPAE